MHKRLFKKKADIKNYSTKVILDADGVRKEHVENDLAEAEREWLLITCDGLPYTHCLNIIRNTHHCATCSKKFKFISELTTHNKADGRADG